MIRILATCQVFPTKRADIMSVEKPSIFGEACGGWVTNRGVGILSHVPCTVSSGDYDYCELTAQRTPSKKAPRIPIMLPYVDPRVLQGTPEEAGGCIPLRRGVCRLCKHHPTAKDTRRRLRIHTPERHEFARQQDGDHVNVFSFHFFRFFHILRRKRLPCRPPSATP